MSFRYTWVLAILFIQLTFWVYFIIKRQKQPPGLFSYAMDKILAKDLNRFYKKNLNKPFKAFNKGKGSNYDPVTIADKKFEKFRIKKRLDCGIQATRYGR